MLLQEIGMMKPGAKAALLLMAVFLTAIAACSQEPKDSRMGREVAKLRKQVDALSAKPSSLYFTFQNIMPMMFQDIDRGFVSLVVFPEEAKISEWQKHYDACKKGNSGECKKCGDGENSGSPAVCPEREFHRMLLRPLISELARCASSEKKVKLEIVGFASELGVSKSNGVREKLLDEAMPLMDCPGPCSSLSCDSQKFNLVVANARADNTERMLESFIKDEQQNHLEVKATPWEDYCGMQRERDRHANGEYSPNNGLMNRRAEIRIVSLPACNFIGLPGDYDSNQGRQQGISAEQGTP